MSKIKVELPQSTQKIAVPEKIIDQVIGQDRAVEIIKKAAKQRRHVLLIGEPGTGKSMIAQGMSELLPRGELEDITVRENHDDPNNPIVEAFPRGKGKAIVDQWKGEMHKVDNFVNTLFFFLFFSVMFITAYSPRMIYQLNKGFWTVCTFSHLSMNYSVSKKSRLTGFWSRDYRNTL